MLEEANLHTLNFVSLLNKDEKSLSTLLSVCDNYGFFYLDLRNYDSGTMLKNYETAGQVVKKWVNQPLEEKLKTETISDSHGYKPPGVQSGVNENTRDRFEALRVSPELSLETRQVHQGTKTKTPTDQLCWLTRKKPPPQCDCRELQVV